MSLHNFCKLSPDEASRIITGMTQIITDLRAAGDELVDYARGCDTPDAHAAVKRWERLNNDDDE